MIVLLKCDLISKKHTIYKSSMSSWGASTKTQMKKKPDGYFFQPNVNQEICNLWNEFFDICLYAKTKQKSVFIQENNLEPGFKCLQHIFRAPFNVEFVDLPNPYYTPIEKENIKINISHSEQRTFAKEIFAIRNDVKETLQLLNTGLPEKFDVGVSIDPITHLPISDYISLLHKLTKGAELHIFIMSTYPKGIEEFKNIVEEYQLPWHLYHSDLQAKKSSSKKVNLFEYLSEVENMKHARIILCGASTPLGKYLYRTCDYIDNFIGIEPK
jgi:hypothetical protein